MKTSWTAFFVTFVVVVTALMDPVTASCKTACQSQLVHFREESCQKWRERLPRPDLFNHCGQGFNKGKSAGCEGYCKESPDLGSMKSLRLDACSSLKGVPPHERQQACQAGFSAALDLAKDAAVPGDDQVPATPSDSSTQGSQTGGTDAGTGRKLEEKQQVKIKKIIPENPAQPVRRNLLDEARAEAANAFAEGGEKLEL